MLKNNRKLMLIILLKYNWILLTLISGLPKCVIMFDTIAVYCCAVSLTPAVCVYSLKWDTSLWLSGIYIQTNKCDLYLLFKFSEQVEHVLSHQLSGCDPYCWCSLVQWQLRLRRTKLSLSCHMLRQWTLSDYALRAGWKWVRLKTYGLFLDFFFKDKNRFFLFI